MQLAPPGKVPVAPATELGSSVKVTEPVGAALSPASVSETVALQEPVSCSASEAGQAIVVEVERLVTVIESLPALVSCRALPP